MIVCTTCMHQKTCVWKKLFDMTHATVESSIQNAFSKNAGEEIGDPPLKIKLEIPECKDYQKDERVDQLNTMLQKEQLLAAQQALTSQIRTSFCSLPLIQHPYQYPYYSCFSPDLGNKLF